MDITAAMDICATPDQRLQPSGRSTPRNLSCLEKELSGHDCDDCLLLKANDLHLSLPTKVDVALKDFCATFDHASFLKVSSAIVKCSVEVTSVRGATPKPVGQARAAGTSIRARATAQWFHNSGRQSFMVS